MKTNSLSIHVLLNLLLTCAALGQASFGFRNYDPAYGINAPVFDAQGALLVGPNYLAELWGGDAPDSLTPLLVLNQGNRREVLPFNDAGHVISISAFLSVPSVPPRGWAWLEMRAWDSRLGSTYEEVIASGFGGYGESPLFYAQGANPLLLLPESPAPLIGLQSFSLRPVIPEPATWALFTLGGTALFWASRRRAQRRL